jgi:general secretion pathway protein A
MYESFYGLTSKPFQLNPDPKFYFASKQHRRATAYLEYGMHQNEGFIVITGEVGAGKTTIVRGMLENLDQDKVVAAHLVSTQLDADDTLRLVGAAFGIRTKDVEKSDVLMSLEAFLISMTGKGKRCLLIVDEAQNLTARAVEELRMLSNFQFGNHALLQSFLIGQPEFREVLQSPQMMQFRQRVIASCHIGPMDVDETRGYVEHRLKCAGANEYPAFAPDSFMAIFKASSGIPRRINSVCDRLLLFGYLNDKKEFDARDVEEVAREIFEETQDTSFVQAQRTPNHASGSDLTNTPPDAGLQPRKVDGKQRQAAAAGKELDASSREDMNHLLAGLNAWQFNERLGRLEQSLQQLELINGTTLSLLQKIVSSIVPDNEPSPTKPPPIVLGNEAPAEESSSIASDNETSSEKSSSISPGTRTKTKRSKLRNPRKASPRPASSGELPLNEPSIVPSIPSSNTTNT